MAETLANITVPIQAQGRISRRQHVGNKIYEGLIRIGGKTVLSTAFLYADPDQAAKIAIAEWVEVLRAGVERDGDFVYVTEAELQDQATAMRPMRKSIAGDGKSV